MWPTFFKKSTKRSEKEKAAEWWRRYGVYLVGVAVAIVLGFGGFKAWQAYDLSQRGERSDAFAAASALAQSGDREAALAAFSEIAGGGDKSYGVLAAFAEARMLADDGAVPEAIAIWDRIAASPDAGSGFTGIATLLSVLHQLDSGDPGDLRARLDPLAAAGPFRPGALELLAAVELRAGNRAEARLLYGQIADDVTAPQGTKGPRRGDARRSRRVKRPRRTMRPCAESRGSFSVRPADRFEQRLLRATAVGRGAFVALSCLVLAACGSGFFGESDDGPPLPGERIAILDFDRKIEADSSIAEEPVVLPPAYPNADWSQPGGDARHALYHLSFSSSPEVVWQADVGSGSDDEVRLLAQPIVVDGVVYAMDALSQVSAFDAGTGKRLWDVDLEDEVEDDGFFGGGLAFGDGRLFVTTGFAKVFALDPADGSVLWVRQAPAPMRSGPAFANGRIYILTVDNQMVAVNALDGRLLWNHIGVEETASLVGLSTVAVADNLVVVPYSSGELIGIEAETGRVLWQESLAALNRLDPLADIPQIRGLPVIDRDQVFRHQPCRPHGRPGPAAGYTAVGHRSRRRTDALAGRGLSLRANQPIATGQCSPARWSYSLGTGFGALRGPGGSRRSDPLVRAAARRRARHRGELSGPAGAVLPRIGRDSLDRRFAGEPGPSAQA